MTALVLSYMSGPEDGRTIAIEVEDKISVVTIGRSIESTICIADDPDASRRHARIVRRDDGWWLEDLSSANGTFIGEFAHARKISTPARLLPGLIFRTGLTRFRLEKEGFQFDKLTMAANISDGLTENSHGYSASELIVQR